MVTTPFETFLYTTRSEENAGHTPSKIENGAKPGIRLSPHGLVISVLSKRFVISWQTEWGAPQIQCANT